MNNVIKRFKFPEIVYNINSKGKKLIYPIASGSYYRMKHIDIKIKLKNVSNNNFKEILIINSLFKLEKDLYT